MITVVCYLWPGVRGFSPAYVNALAAMVRHYHPEPHRFVCVNDGPAAGFSLGVEVIALPQEAAVLGAIPNPGGAKFPSSYRRLWTLSRAAAGILGERVLVLDIDCMVVGRLSRLLAVDGDFVGWRVRPPPGCPPRFGGGTWLHRTGTRTSVYEDFLADPAGCIERAWSAGYRGSDQGWLSYRLAGVEASWPEPSGIYCAQDYRKEWRRGQTRFLGRRRPASVVTPLPKLRVPRDAVILHMNGVEKPWDTNDEIVRAHWRPFYEQELRSNVERSHVAVE